MSLRIELGVMHPTLRLVVRSLTAIAVGVFVSVLAFDLTVVRATVKKIDLQLANAAPDERVPPAQLAEILDRVYGSHLKFIVARSALFTEPNQLDGMGTIQRPLVEFGVGHLLRLHYSGAEIESAFLSSSFMGPAAHGYAQAAKLYLGVPLESVTPEQAATLVAIGFAPQYLQDPERLARKTQHILSLAAK